MPARRPRHTAAPRLIASHALAGVAVSLPWPALLAEIWRSTDDALLIGLAGAARFAPCVLLSAFLGGVGDRYGRFRAVRVVTVVRAMLLAVATGFMVAELPWAALAVTTLTVAAGVPAFPSLAALVPQVASRPGRATNALVTWEISGFVVGPALGGLLLGFGSAVSVAPCAPLMVAALLMLPRRVVDAAPASGRVRLLSRLREVLAVPTVRRAVASVMMLNAVIGVLGVALLSITITHWGGGVAEFGWLTAAQGFASLTAPALILVVGRLAPGLTVQVLVVLPLAALAVVPSVAIGAVPLVLLGAGLTVVECGATRMLQQEAPTRYIATALGIADAALVSAAMLGALVAPWLLGLLGSTGLLLGLAVVCAAVLGWGLRRGRSRPVVVQPVSADAVRLAA